MYPSNLARMVISESLMREGIYYSVGVHFVEEIVARLIECGAIPSDDTAKLHGIKPTADTPQSTEDRPESPDSGPASRLIAALTGFIDEKFGREDPDCPENIPPIPQPPDGAQRIHHHAQGARTRKVRDGIGPLGPVAELERAAGRC